MFYCDVISKSECNKTGNISVMSVRPALQKHFQVRDFEMRFTPFTEMVSTSSSGREFCRILEAKVNVTIHLNMIRVFILLDRLI